MTEKFDKKDESQSEVSQNLLAHLSNDVELYHKRVQLKRQLKEQLGKDEKKPKENASSTQETQEQLPEPETTSEFGVNIPDQVEESPIPSFFSMDKETPVRSRAWTKAEDDAIIYYKEEMKYSWKEIEKILKNRHSWQAIQMRYLRNHKSKSDSWSRFMELRLINAIRKDWEGRWKRISKDLGNDLTVDRCLMKNVELCKKMDDPIFGKIFSNKEITQGYSNPNSDIKDEDSHRKLMLVYMGLDSISYESDEGEHNGEENGD
ncbi:hypothetical protein OGAPHI_001453 [Ogataea philodendri]|uniref:Myb-like domain-containing protein n=1 Tax=Ogataea philodendri TaxID=1378263 RepID=A0A9P8PC84_9ASCO|nr:uncharacterized protein OGAPHI_001453 [Ogataea philodendri]KAH3669332.1 hypothetical protein OGAPHI_001453 [Ogataea philodendri]